ncbi:hypothetical protein TanjilG_15942 [Lupinus angustifolius]|uniref:Uncharacterized protein n=1 Tax=Lupinus angustifolius TaxID=3871 RepID=A0A4P1RGI7_LUPAN|nr:PREDICTED: uncharacterized protein LOC109349197 [Lupinus angustifolius]OIW10570.1 hypothetical protein TanjilG_15942 [Lupinus angustifolius]
MALQLQPLQQQQQPVQVYPDTVTDQPSPHHSNGSFGSVFVVLAIIVVISAVACCLGRFCSRGQSQKHGKQKRQHNHHHHDMRPKEVDIEFGFDKKIAASKPNGHGHGAARGPMPMKPMSAHHGHVDMRSFEMKLGHGGKIRAGP